MKKVINGKTYDTSTARLIAKSKEGELYEKKTGEYFLRVTQKEIRLDIIHPITKKQAEQWADETAEEFAPFG